jgi:hypothetical protein
VDCVGTVELGGKCMSFYDPDSLRAVDSLQASAGLIRAVQHVPTLR